MYLYIAKWEMRVLKAFITKTNIYIYIDIYMFFHEKLNGEKFEIYNFHVTMATELTK